MSNMTREKNYIRFTQLQENNRRYYYTNIIYTNISNNIIIVSYNIVIRVRALF